MILLYGEYEIEHMDPVMWLAVYEQMAAKDRQSIMDFYWKGQINVEFFIGDTVDAKLKPS